MTIRSEQRGDRPVLILDIQYTTPTGSHQRYRRDAQVQTRTAARAEHDRLMRQLALTGEIPTTAPEREASLAHTWDDAVKYYREHVAPALKPSTRVGYAALLDGPILRRWSTRPISEVGEQVVSELDAVLAKKRASPSSRRNHQIVVRRILRAPVVAGYLPAMPTLPGLPKVGTTIVKVPTTDEVDRVIAAARSHQRVALALAGYAGLRAGEIRGLRRCDVDLRTGLLTVRESRCRGEIAPPKSGSERVVPIAASLRPHLVASLGKGKDEPLTNVSRTREGRPWCETGIASALIRAQKRAGVSGWTLHALRHYFVTSLFRHAVGAPVVQRLAGHHSLAVTQRYAHATEDDLRLAVGMLG